MFYYLYKITNLINNKVYIGVHQTNKLNDGYFGSGININRAIKKYGKDNFSKEILEYFNTEEDMLLKEKEIVNSDFVKLAHVYNINEGGKGSFSYINSLPNQGHRPGQQKEASKIAANKLKYDLEHREKFCAKMRKSNQRRVNEGSMAWQKPGYKNPALTRKWISNDATQKSQYIETSNLDQYLQQGWYLGRKYNQYNTNRDLYKKRN